MNARTLIVAALMCVLASACDDTTPPAGTTTQAASPPIATEKVDASLSAVQQYLQSGELAKAEAIARTLVQRAPGEGRSHEMLGQVMIEKAGAAEQSGDASAAIDLKKQAWASYQKAAELDHANPALLHSAGMIAMTAGESAAALALFLKAESLDGSQSQYPLFAAQILFQQQRLDEAEAALKRALAVAPDEPYVHASLAMVALERKDFATALSEIAQSRLAEPDNIEFRAQQAKIHRRRNQPREALELLIGLDERSRAQEVVAFEIASAYESLNEPAKAAASWVLCARLHARSPVSFRAAVNAAECYLKAGDRAQAAEWAAVAERMNPEAPEVAALRSKLTLATP